MTLGDDIAAALPELQAQAESMMRDTCRITGAPSAGAFDEDSGSAPAGSSALLYEGKCRVRQPQDAGDRRDAGEAAYSVSDRIVSIPLRGSGYAPGVVDIPVGATVTMTSVGDLSDPGLAGKVFTYRKPESQNTAATARRMRCEAVSRDGNS